MNDLFALNNALVEYTTDQETKICEDLDCENDQMCSCSMCVCCSACSALCECQMATRDPNKKMADILGFGDSAYR